MRSEFKVVILLVVSICVSIDMTAQELRNRVIVQYRDEFSSISLGTNNRSSVNISFLSGRAKLALMEFDHDLSALELSQIRSNRTIVSAYFDHRLEERNKPNDPTLASQWYIDFLKLPDVWQVTTGGKTSGGRQIVIAVLDSGIQLDHPDLKDNIYVNPLEIPNNGKDDDNNGYIDDVSGINASTGNGRTHVSTNHGTWVSGVVGAKGNNGIGVTGVNWDVKILPITGISTVSDIIKGYEYIRSVKSQYNQANGGKGPFIIATNYSGGLPSKFGTDPAFKPWCDLYDAMGEQGIISVGSTVNRAVNVDIEGDLPTTCESPYLISVTNITKEATLESDAGFGKKHIDIGAPGQGISNLGSANGYFTDTGTSASAPMVAGMISLLYSVPCPSFELMIQQNRLLAATKVRDAILKGVDPNPSLEGKTSTGGHLNALKALLNMQGVCDNMLVLPSKKGDLKIEGFSRFGGELTMAYLSLDESPLDLFVYNALGQIVAESVITPPAIGVKEIKMDVSGYATGVYYFSLHSGNEKVSKAMLIP